MKTTQKFITTFVTLATLTMLGCGNSSSKAPKSIPSDTANLLVETSKVSGACSNKGLPGYIPPSCVDFYDSSGLELAKSSCEENAEFSKWLDKCTFENRSGGCLSKASNTVLWFYGPIDEGMNLPGSCINQGSEWVNDKATAEAILKV